MLELYVMWLQLRFEVSSRPPYTMDRPGFVTKQRSCYADLELCMAIGTEPSQCVTVSSIAADSLRRPPLCKSNVREHTGAYYVQATQQCLCLPTAIASSLCANRPVSINKFGLKVDQR